MAEISIEALKEFVNTLSGDAKDKAVAWVASMQQAGKTMLDVNEASKFLNVTTDVLTKSATNLGKAFSEVFQNFKVDTFIKQMGSVGDNVTKSMLQTVAAFAPMTGLLPHSAELYGQLGDAANLSGAQAAKSWDNVSKIIPGLDDSTKNLVGTMLNASDRFRNVQNNIIGLYAASGNLPSLFTQVGATATSTAASFKNLDDVMAGYIDKTYQIAQSSNVSMTQVSKYADSLRKIPDALDQVVGIGAGGTKTMNALDATLKIASATGMKHEDAVNQLSWAYEKFGTTGDDAVSMIAYMAEAAQDSKMPLEDFRKTVMNISEQFKMFGDNTEGVTNIVGTFTKAFRESGLGPEGAAELVSTMISGVKQMDLAHKAFFSSASGGQGGLGGAFEIDYLLQQGDTDKVMEKVLSGLENQFGRVVTLAEAQGSPELQGELIKQMAFLKDVAGIAKTDEEAYRILEAMQKGATDELASIMEGAKDPQVIMQQAIERGTQAQEKTYSAMVRLSNNLERSAAYSDMAAGKLVTRALGTNMESQEAAESARNKASVRVVADGSYTKFGQETVTETMKTLTDQVPRFKGVAEEFMKDADKLFDHSKPATAVNPELPAVPEETTQAPGPGILPEGIPAPAQARPYGALATETLLRRNLPMPVAPERKPEPAEMREPKETAHTVVVKLDMSKDFEKYLEAKIQEMAESQAQRTFGVRND